MIQVKKHRLFRAEPVPFGRAWWSNRSAPRQLGLGRPEAIEMIHDPLEKLRQRLETLERQMEPLKREQRSAVLEFILQATAIYDIQPEELYPDGTADPQPEGGSTRRKRGAALIGRKLPVKYQDQHGNTWSGRGSEPRWIQEALAAGHCLEDFLVQAA